MLTRGKLDVNLPLVDAYVLAEQTLIQPPNTGNCVGTPVTPGPTPLYGNDGSPIVNYVGSPTKRVISPSRLIDSPHRPIGSPQRHVGSPLRKVGSPDSRVGSPSRHVDDYGEATPGLEGGSEEGKRESRASTAKTVKFEVRYLDILVIMAV